jgi:hypothetical protein
MLAFVLLLALSAQDTPVLLKSPPPGPSATIREGDRRLLDVSRVPEAGRAEDDFQAPGWRIEAMYQGDLNGDGRSDTALQLAEDLPLEAEDGTWNERHRALLILLRQPDGTFRRAAAATRLLYCSTCGGMLSDPQGGNINGEVKDGVLVISQLSGSRWATDHVWRFRLDLRTGRFLLIGEDVNTYDRAAGGGADTSTNYLTGLRVVTRSEVLKEGADPRVVSIKRSRVRPARRYLEDVDYEAQ